VADALDELLAGMARLLEQQDDTPAPRAVGEGNFRCVRCEGCNDCRFCTDCDDCVECTYAEGCVACTNCTQSKWCRDCERVSHSQLSRACDDCSYITLCIGCESCVHCFACVAMQGGEFCILNEKVGRKEYQARVSELRAAIERRLAEGWRPDWLRDEDVPSEEPELEPEPEPELELAPVRVEPVRVEPDVPQPRADEITVKRPAPVREPEPAVTTRAGSPSVTRGARPQRGGDSGRQSVVAARRPPRG
jgi:hypothetical protein